MREYNIIDFGAKADGVTDNAAAIQKAIDQCSEAGGGVVTVPSSNVFMAGPFDLKSHVQLFVESDAVLLANPDESVYTKSAFPGNPGEGSIWIGGENAQNISIAGTGTIDGNGIRFMGPEEKAAFVLKDFDTIDARPHLLTLVNVQNLSIRDVTFKDSAYWCLHLVGCDNVRIEGIAIRNHLKIRNSDGIDLDHTRNVRIHNCLIQSADDCICFKTRREYEAFGPTENVIVSDCIMTSTSCSIKLGSENMHGIRNVLVTGCIIRSSNRGIGIQNRDEGFVEDVVFDNILVEGRLFDDVWWGKAEPIYVTAYKRKSSSHKDSNVRFAKGQTEGRVGRVSNIRFSNMNCRSENGVFVGGEAGKVRDIAFQNITLHINKVTRYQGGIYDLRPSDSVGLLEAETAGFYFSQAENISLENCRLTWGENRASYFNKVLYAEKVDGFKAINLSGQSAKSGSEALALHACTDVHIK